MSFSRNQCDDDSDEETVSSILKKTISTLKSNLLPMPDVPINKLSHEFDLDETSSALEITSLDITTHGCYIVAGCSNGLILLFDMINNSR